MICLLYMATTTQWKLSILTNQIKKKPRSTYLCITIIRIHKHSYFLLMFEKRKIKFSRYHLFFHLLASVYWRLFGHFWWSTQQTHMISIFADALLLHLLELTIILEKKSNKERNSHYNLSKTSPWLSLVFIKYHFRLTAWFIDSQQIIGMRHNLLKRMIV